MKLLSRTKMTPTLLTMSKPVTQTTQPTIGMKLTEKPGAMLKENPMPMLKVMPLATILETRMDCSPLLRPEVLSAQAANLRLG